jgi:CubicO group peptidase (beta-lactamase class C family)
MRKPTTNMALIIFALLCSGVGNAQNKLDSFVRSEMVRNKIPGMALLLAKDGKTLLRKAYGFSDLQFKIAMRGDTLFQIASTTKIFTGIALGLLEQEQKLSLDDTAGKYLSDLPEAWRLVTLRQMAAHVSGLPDFIESPDAPLSSAVLQRTERESLLYAESLPLRAKPGARFNYDQTNFLLLKQVIESVAGSSFENFVRTKIFAPLRMTSTGWADMREIVPGRSSLYSTVSAFTNLPAGTLANSVTPYVYPPFMSTAAGLNSNVDDLGKLGAALSEGRLLTVSEQNRIWMFTRHPDGQIVDLAKDMHMPGTTGPVVGWFRTERPGKQHPAVWMDGGSSTAFMYFPSDKMTVIVLTNLQGADPLSLAEAIAGFYLTDLVKVL